MSYSEWKEVELESVINFNPKESLKKGQVAKKVAMDKLDTFNREIQGYEECEFKGGTKFRNGDTLLARITPCLENGKTAQVSILDKGEVGFGSTEFIVMREKESITCNDYIYYLAISPQFRNIAIKSMTGTSGRQRVQGDVLQRSKINLPSLQEQKAIANILSSLDEKIELNNQMNKTLGEMAQVLFKRWFVDFEFPDEDGEPYKSSGGEMVDSELGMIPKGWVVSTLGNIINIASGKRPPKKSPILDSEYIIPLIGASSIMGYVPEPLFDEPILVIGRVGTHGVVQRFNNKVWPSDNTLVIKTAYYEYVYQILKLIDYSAINRGSTQPLITQSDVKATNIIKPGLDIMKKYEEIISKLFEQVNCNNTQNKMLETSRDTLLPKLMSGEIRITDLQN